MSGLAIPFAFLKLYHGGNFKTCMYVHLHCAEMCTNTAGRKYTDLLTMIFYEQRGSGCFSYFSLTVSAFFKISIVTIHYFIIKKIQEKIYRNLC